MKSIGTIPKQKYTERFGSTGPDLELNTKEKLLEEKEKRIQLYAKRWERGYECISGKPLMGGELEDWYRWRVMWDKKTEAQKKSLSGEFSCSFFETEGYNE